MPTIRQLLDLSTAHLPPHHRQYLSAEPGVIAYLMTYGWLLWVPDDPDGSAADGADAVPAEVLAIQRYARIHGCDYVLLDADGDIVDELPAWNT